MRDFLHYWFVAVPKLTKDQAFTVFYRFVRYVSWSYNVEWGDQPWGDDDYGDYCSARAGEGFCYDPKCKVMEAWLKREKEAKGDTVV